MKQYPAEMLDQYIRLQSVTNDHQIRCVIRLEEPVDGEKLKQSIEKSFDYIPILRCAFSREGTRYFWEEREYSESDYFRFYEVSGDREDIIGYLKNIPGDNGPQVLVQLIRNSQSDTLIITVNHMAFDGFGFKSYLYLLSSIYSNSPIGEMETDRRIKTLLRNVFFGEKTLSLSRKSYKPSDSPLPEDSGDQTETRLGRLLVDSARFRDIKDFCIGESISLNDFILTLYVYALFSMGGNEMENLTLQVMIDLRRYVRKSGVSPYGNFSSMESISFTNKNRSFPVLAKEISAYMSRVKTEAPGLKNILLMRFFYKILPGKTFDKLLSRTIKSLGLSTSNLGVVEKEKLNFDGINISDAYMLTSIKNEPAMQLSFSTFGETMSLSILGNYSENNWKAIEGLMGRMSEILDRLI